MRLGEILDVVVLFMKNIVCLCFLVFVVGMLE